MKTWELHKWQDSDDRVQVVVGAVCEGFPVDKRKALEDERKWRRDLETDQAKARRALEARVATIWGLREELLYVHGVRDDA